METQGIWLPVYLVGQATLAAGGAGIYAPLSIFHSWFSIHYVTRGI